MARVAATSSAASYLLLTLGLRVRLDLWRTLAGGRGGRNGRVIILILPTSRGGEASAEVQLMPGAVGRVVEVAVVPAAAREAVPNPQTGRARRRGRERVLGFRHRLRGWVGAKDESRSEVTS